MPCQLQNIQFNDATLQPLFARIETATSLSALVLAGWQFALRLWRHPGGGTGGHRCHRFTALPALFQVSTINSRATH